MSVPDGSEPSALTGLSHLGVLVPVRDEERLLGRCLRSLGSAADALRAARPGVHLTVVVVLDGCRDGSAEAARAATWSPDLPLPHLISTEPVGVGAARRRGATHLLEQAGTGGGRPGTTWIAGTDADSTVPPGWLLEQVRAAEAGFHARVGTVVLSSPRDQLAARWTEQQQHVEGHPHVHGANLGVRGDAYLAVDGYPEVVTGEDVHLVQALERAGARLLRTAQHPVVTSDRREGRAPEGVAADLAELAAAEPGVRAS
ncbi:glycosyltransferase [Aquipuribacter sp. MA13-6]|uniref:glycosyltransferase n=1 Tax=unclassified Aquipuribacter TaxID=2635084 RepID=UPI003EEF6D21